MRDKDVREVLEEVLGSHFGNGHKIMGLKHRPYAYRTTFALEEITVELEDGDRLHLLLKDLSWRRLDEAARRAKPRFLYEPMRELETYGAIAELGVAPTYYGSSTNPDRDHYWVLIEKVEGVELWQVGERSVWRKVARWLARFHERHADLRPLHAIVYDGDLYHTWLGRAREFTGSPDLDRIAERYDEVVERLCELPAGFIHGEFYPSNVLVSNPKGDVEIRAVDWEMAAIGPGLLDLAALAGGWDEKATAGILSAYRNALQDPPPEEEFEAAFDCARLHVAVQWLGWASDWTPPEEHAQSWLDEAVEVAAKLGL